MRYLGPLYFFTFGSAGSGKVEKHIGCVGGRSKLLALASGLLGR